MSSTFLTNLPHLASIFRGGIAPSTYSAYRRSVDIFMRDCNLLYSYLRRLTVNSIDKRFSAWIIRQFDARGTRSIQRAENARNGLHLFFPKTRRLLTRSDVALRSWRRQRDVNSYPPIPRTIATLLAARLAAGGDIHAALAVLLSFDCYLRINECMQLRRRDVRIPDDRLGNPYENSAVFVRKAKTGTNQTVSIADPAVARLLHRCILSLPHDDSRIFPFSATVFRETHMKGTLSLMGLGHLHFVPHSFRHGSATHDLVCKRMSPESIRLRGRWRSQLSADRYMQRLAALDLTFLIPRDVDKKGADLWLLLDFVTDLSVNEVGLWPALPPLPDDVRHRRL